MSSLQKKYQKTAILLEDCRKFATFTQNTYQQPTFHNEEFTVQAWSYVMANSFAKKEIINRNANKIKYLKQRLKCLSYRIEIDSNPENVVILTPKISDKLSWEDFIKELIKYANKMYQQRNVVDKPLYNSLVNSASLKGCKKLYLIRAEYNDYFFHVNPFSTYEDVLNDYQQSYFKR